MAADQPTQEPRSLEMRVAAIEDKLSQWTVSEAEMQAYMKVASLIAGSGSAATGITRACQVSSVNPIFNPIYNPIYNPIIGYPIYNPPIVVNDCIQFSNLGAGSSVGFGTLGGT